MWAPQPRQPVCSGCQLGRLCCASSSWDYDLKNISKETPFSLYTRGIGIHPTVSNMTHWETYHWETNSMCTNAKSNIYIYTQSQSYGFLKTGLLQREVMGLTEVFLAELWRCVLQVPCAAPLSILTHELGQAVPGSTTWMRVSHRSYWRFKILQDMSA